MVRLLSFCKFIVCLLITLLLFCFLSCSNDTVTVRAEAEEEDWVYKVEKGDRLQVPGVLIPDRLMFDWICVMTRKKLGIKPLPNDPNIWEKVLEPMATEEKE